jgi:sortase (surface protein transpeptidase)
VKNKQKEEKEDDFFELSKEMTKEEMEKYKDTSYIVIPKINVSAPIFYPNIEEKDLE